MTAYTVSVIFDPFDCGHFYSDGQKWVRNISDPSPQILFLQVSHDSILLNWKFNA